MSSKLGFIFNPASIAVIGASDDPRKYGHEILKNLIEGGFPGRALSDKPQDRTYSGDKLPQECQGNSRAGGPGGSDSPRENSSPGRPGVRRAWNKGRYRDLGRIQRGRSPRRGVTEKAREGCRTTRGSAGRSELPGCKQPLPPHVRHMAASHPKGPCSRHQPERHRRGGDARLVPGGRTRGLRFRGSGKPCGH